MDTDDKYDYENGQCYIVGDALETMIDENAKEAFEDRREERL